MNRTLKKLAIIAGTAIPAAAMLFGTASAGVSALSKVKNGTFDSNTSHWSATVSPTAKLTAGFGVLKVSNTTNTVNSTHAHAYQCIAINDKNKVEVAGKIKIISGQVRTGSANLGLTYFPNEHCTGAPLASGFTQMVTQVGVWKSQKVVMTPPAGTKSAWIRLGVVKHASQQLPQAFLPFSVYFDDVQVVAQLIKFPGPINPNPTQTPAPQDPPQQPPADDQDDPAPDPTPAPQDDPQQPQDQPDPAPADPQDEPADQPADEPTPADEPAPADGETVEETVPGPDVPDEPYSEDDGSDSSSSDPSETGSTSSDGDDSNSSDGDAQGTSTDGDQESDVQTLGEAEDKQPAKPTKKSSTGTGSPTPEAPAAGNAAAPEDGLLGTTELAIIGGFAVAGLALTFLATSRRKRQPTANDEDYYLD